MIGLWVIDVHLQARVQHYQFVREMAVSKERVLKQSLGTSQHGLWRGWGWRMGFRWLQWSLVVLYNVYLLFLVCCLHTGCLYIFVVPVCLHT